MALSRESTTYPRWISRASSGSGVRNKRKRTPIQCFCGCAKKKRVCCQLAILRTGVRGGKKVCVSSVIFLCERANTPQTLTIFFFMFLRHKKRGRGFPLRRRRVFREQRVDDGAEPPYVPDHVRRLRGARRRGRPRGVHPHRRAKRRVDAPLRRRRREEKEKATSVSPRAAKLGSARRRTPSDERSRERRNAWARGFEKGEKEEEPLLSVTRALPVRPSRASRRRARLRLARTPRRDTP